MGTTRAAVAGRGTVAPVAAIEPEFPAGTFRRYQETSIFSSFFFLANSLEFGLHTCLPSCPMWLVLHSQTTLVAYQVILEPGIGQFREFEPHRVHTRVNSLGLLLVHKLTCGKRESLS